MLTQSPPDKPPITSRISLFDLTGGERIADPSRVVESMDKSSQNRGTKVKPFSTVETEADETKRGNSSRDEMRTFER